MIFILPPKKNTTLTPKNQTTIELDIIEPWRVGFLDFRLQLPPRWALTVEHLGNILKRFFKAAQQSAERMDVIFPPGKKHASHNTAAPRVWNSIYTDGPQTPDLSYMQSLQTAAEDVFIGQCDRSAV